MKQAVIIVAIFFAFVIGGCSGNKAAELFETAKFEELQNNKEHAAQLYEEIINKYPESEHAKNARERLSKIKGTSGNTPK